MIKQKELEMENTNLKVLLKESETALRISENKRESLLIDLERLLNEYE